MATSHRPPSLELIVIAFLSSILSLSLAHAADPTPPPDLKNYVNKKDDSFTWRKSDTTVSPLGTVHELAMTSQTWHGLKWTHQIQVFVPKDAKPQATMLLYNTGGGPSPTSAILGLQLAQKIGAPVAFLFGIPNQPIYGKREDALIAETFVRYLKDGDGSWPLLFPMVKSVIRSMDALQSFAKDEWKMELSHFIITGASKRGWTSWLTAATGDPRVKAIAPMVIDTLNMQVQMKNQVKAFGKPSRMIQDYVNRGLVPIPDTERAHKLWTMIDPYIYRKQLTLPKLIICGTNDPYWTLDALNSYWDDLPGEKYLLYVPNAGHDLREVKDGDKELIPNRAVNTLSAFARSQIFDTPMPKVSWEYNVDGDQQLALRNSPSGFITIREWRATSMTLDFRQSDWQTRELNKLGSTPGIPKGNERFLAFFLEAEYERDGLRFTLSTQLHIVENKK